MCVPDASRPGRELVDAGAPPPGLMTVGELARRTGLKRKAIRAYEGLGLIDSAGRSEANYRLFDQSALRCVQGIRTLRALGLTLKELQALAAVCREQPDEPLGPRLAALIDEAERRIDERVAELETTRRRISSFRSANAAALAGTPSVDLVLGRPGQP